MERNPNNFALAMVYFDTYGGRTAVVLEAQHVQLGDCVIHIAHVLLSELGAMETSKISENPMDHYVPASTGAVLFLIYPLVI